MKPMEIEQKSFAIIAEELGERRIDPEYDLLVRRVIHTTADFDYYDNLCFSPHAVLTTEAALKSGCALVTDTTMAQAGINKRALAALGCRTYCFIADEDVAREAKERGETRSYVAVEKAARTIKEPILFAVGNAPTALFSICRLIRAGQLSPAMVIGVPVGFVNVVEAKEELMKTAENYIVARGRKGGSNVAAAIVNSVLYRLTER